MNTAGKTITCRAAVTRSPNNQTIETIEVHPPKKGEVRVRIVACGICGSDNHILNANSERASTVRWPCILGHEASGIIESVGDGVISVTTGDHVVALWQPQCGTCKLCTGDVSNFCITAKTDDAVTEKWTQIDNTTRYFCRGEPVYRYLGTGAFSEYIVLHESAVAKIPKDLPLEKMCIFGCGIPTGYGAAVNGAKVWKGSIVAIWGLGTVGLGAVKGAKDAGAAQIIGIDTNNKKFETAKKFGCTKVINPLELKEPLKDYFKSNNGLIDIGIDCVGVSTAILETILESTKPWGRCIVVGLIPRSFKLQVTPLDFIRGKILSGVDFGNFKGKDAIKFFAEKYSNGDFPIENLITGTITLDEINKGFQELRSGDAIKTIVLMK